MNTFLVLLKQWLYFS